MRSIYFSLTVILLSAALYANAQTKGAWYHYYDEKQDLYGFKDSKGKVMIRPRFNGLTNTIVFDDIMAVTDGVSGKSYYLLKNGKKAGVDSLYVWDMTYDCEQEGKIRFRDPVTDKVGFLNKNGKVAIKALYNDARPFYNGLALVIYNGKRICLDGKPYDAEKCEHWIWDGTTALIDSSGNIVADHLDYDETLHLNWYSFTLGKAPVNSKIYTSFKSINGQYCYFIDYQKEFKTWFYDRFMVDVANHSDAGYYKVITVQNITKPDLEKLYPKTAFLNKYLPVMKKRLEDIKKGKLDAVILPSELNVYTQNHRTFKSYYTNCGEQNRQQYPVFEVVISSYNAYKKRPNQERFAFLRTAQGYKLIAVVWQNMPNKL